MQQEIIVGRGVFYKDPFLSKESRRLLFPELLVVHVSYCKHNILRSTQRVKLGMGTKIQVGFM
jgi:hypothetical protein